MQRKDPVLPDNPTTLVRCIRGPFTTWWCARRWRTWAGRNRVCICYAANRDRGAIVAQALALGTTALRGVRTDTHRL